MHIAKKLSALRAPNRPLFPLGLRFPGLHYHISKCLTNTRGDVQTKALRKSSV
jgi:hypothetical protein